ncbi:hypothetical protein [Solimonas flava]|uniref:hypothetical protein n=1 Tax=Solimonas flava TaxID=415849 RepID=UPI000418D846|nr:hypothetical protein [Solimonas flava]
MIHKSYVSAVAALSALTATALAVPAHAGPVLQGVQLNGMRMNGPVLQGVVLNGMRMNGPVLQGVMLNAMPAQARAGEPVAVRLPSGELIPVR